MPFCPCGSNALLSHCCEPYIKGTQHPSTAEGLMRSRYTAFSLGQIPYLVKTMTDPASTHFNPAKTRQWLKKVTWLGLAILRVENGNSTDDLGAVEFIASYSEGGYDKFIRERSLFKKIKGKWYYTDGQHYPR